jgi:hypothetical protein
MVGAEKILTGAVNRSRSRPMALLPAPWSPGLDSTRSSSGGSAKDDAVPAETAIGHVTKGERRTPRSAEAATKSRLRRDPRPCDRAAFRRTDEPDLRRRERAPVRPATWHRQMLSSRCTRARAMLAKPRFGRDTMPCCDLRIEVPLEFQGLGSPAPVW